MKIGLKISKKGVIVGILVGVVVVGGISAYRYKVEQDKIKYEETVYTDALNKYNSKDYIGAIELLITSEKAESQALLEKCYNIEYSKAIQLKEEGAYEDAIEVFNNISEYKDSTEQIELCTISERDEYIEKVGILVYKINKYKELAMSVCTIIDSEWGKAENAETDPTLALNSINGTWASTLQQLSVGRDGLEKQVSSLEILDGSELIYNKLLELYEAYVKINDQSISPSGNHSNYKNSVEKLSNAFDSLLEEIYVLEADIKCVVEMQMSN